VKRQQLVHVDFVLSKPGSTRLAHQLLLPATHVENSLDKLSLRGQGRNTLKHTNSGVCISLERKVYLLEENLGFHEYCRQTFLHMTNSWRQNSQKVLPCGHFEGL
jgi:hypothetical protein